MKKSILKEVHFCDECGQEAYLRVCMGCGVEYCYDCQKVNMVEYSHGVHVSGSGDGYFCLKCDAHPPESLRALLNAYRKIQSLRREEVGFYQEKERASTKAEAEVLRLYTAATYENSRNK